VIVDSSALHERSWEILAEEENRHLPPGHFRQGFGMKNEIIIPRILGWSGEAVEIARLAARKEHIYRDLLQEQGINPLPGVRKLLDELCNNEEPCVIGSSTERANIDCALQGMDLRDYFTDIVSGEQVEHGKPAPDIFLLAAEKTGMPAARCVVFEDAHAGIEAARHAGMAVIALSTTHPAETLSNADLVVASLNALTLQMIVNTLNENRT
jgi:HAD superfamily hydrolase (TIGR01509 family)